MVSQSKTTSCSVLASSKIRSISCCTSAIIFDLEFEPGLLSITVLFEGLLRRDLLAKDISAITRVIIIRPSKRCFKKSNRAFCIMSVTSYPFRDGPTSTTGLIDGTTSYGGVVSCFLKKILRLSLAVGAVNVVLADIRPLPIGSSSSAKFDDDEFLEE